MFQDVNLGGGWRHPFFEHLATNEGVDEGALAGVELADDHQHEELVELTNGRGECRPVFGAGAELRQRIAELSQQVAAAIQLALQIGRQDTSHVQELRTFLSLMKSRPRTAS